jgi:hypothetical protein
MMENFRTGAILAHRMPRMGYERFTVNNGG